MSSHLKAAVCAVVALWWAITPAHAFAGEVLLGFGAAYPSGTHRGIDVASSEGASVAAPASGTIVFAGTVPADGGGTCVAVSILTADGLRVSVLPLSSAAVAEGAAVAAGDELGVLAATGDDSSGTPHVHISLRRGENYLDPSGLVAATPPDQSDLPIAGVSAPPETPDAPSGGGGVSLTSAAVAGGSVAAAAGPVTAGVATTIQAAQPAAPPAVAMRARHSRIPTEAEVPAPSALQSDVTLSRCQMPLRFGAASPQSTLAAIGVLAVALVGLGATRLRAAETRA